MPTRALSKAHVDGAAFDLGPAWFWQGQPRMAAAVSRFGLSVFEQYSRGDMVSQDQNGGVRRGAGFAAMARSLRIAGGMAALVDAYLGQIPSDRCHLNQAAQRIAQTDTGVMVTTNTGSIHAKRVVLAVPPRIAGSIALEPGFSAIQFQSLANIPTWMAGHAKFIGVYDTPLWRDAGLSGDATSRCGPMVEIHDASPQSGGPYAVFGFVGFDAQTRAAHRDEMIKMANDQLTQIFGAAPQELILQDWAQEPQTATKADYTSGGHPAYGRPTALRNIWDGRIIMGSSEMASDFGGYLEGALEAAQDVGALLRAGRQSVTSRP